MKTDTRTLAKSLEILAMDIQSDDGVANAAIFEAAQRLKQLLLDKQRLDWIEQHGLFIATAFPGEKWGRIKPNRAGIDSAKEEQP